MIFWVNLCESIFGEVEVVNSCLAQPKGIASPKPLGALVRRPETPSINGEESLGSQWICFEGMDVYLGLGVLLILLVTSCQMSLLIPIVDVVFTIYQTVQENDPLM